MQLQLNFFNDELNNNLSIVKCDKYKQQGLVYMGSKRLIADYLYHAIKNTLNRAGLNKNGYFIDLFCGGGAMGFCALSHGEKVVFNDKNEYLIFLLQTALMNRKPDIDKIYQELKTHFVTREEFREIKSLVENKSYFEIDCKTALRYAFLLFFSFGGNMCKNYIYGADIEEHKHNLHKLICFHDETAHKALEKHFNISFRLPENETYYNRYLAWKKVLREHNRRMDLQHLEHLQHLERLERLEHKENIVNFSSLDYQKVSFTENDIIYCDPPYENTEKYKNGINHTDFLEWALSQKESVFISEYQDLTPYGFTKIYEREKMVLLNNNNRLKDKEKECLFWNGK